MDYTIEIIEYLFGMATGVILGSLITTEIFK